MPRSMTDREILECVHDCLHYVNGAIGDMYFVGTSGNDSPTHGMDPHTPFLTIDYAIGQCTANNNDAIIVLPGAYDEDANVDGVQVDVAGVTIMGTAHGPNMDEVTVENSNATPATSVFNVTVDNVRILNLQIIETTATVEGIVTSGNNGVYEGIGFVGAMENGIHITGTHNKVNDCEFQDITNDGIEMSGTVNNCRVTDCTFINVGDNAINLNGDGVDGNLVLNNFVNGMGATTTGINIALGDDNMVIRNKIAGCDNWRGDTGTDNRWLDNTREGEGPQDVMINKDLPYLTEYFRTENLDANVWNEQLDGAGTGAFAVGSGYMYYDIDTDAVLNNDVFISTKYRRMSIPSKFGDADLPIRGLVLEFLAKVTGNVADVVNDHFLLGFAPTEDNANTQNNIAAFILSGDALYARTDNGGADEDTDVSGGITVTNWNLYRVEAIPGGYKFYINNALVAMHVTQVPDDEMYIVFGTRSDGVGAVGQDLATISQWYVRCTNG